MSTTTTTSRMQPMTIWLPPDTIDRIAALAARRSEEVGARVSRSAWIAAAIRRALSDAETPAIEEARS